MSIVGERIKALRVDNSMTQKDVGRCLDVSEVTIRCWENGTKNPSMKAIIALASLFQVTTDYVLGVKTTVNGTVLLSKSEKELLSKYNILDKHGKDVVNTICSLEKARVIAESAKFQVVSNPSRYIPKYNTPSAAGYSIPLGGDDFTMILVDSSVPEFADFAVGIQGDSMYPHLHDGDTVYVKKDCDLTVGDVGIFSVDGAMYCKQYYIDDKRNVTLVSANPEYKHTNIFIGADSSFDLRCYGKVLLTDRIELPDYIFD